MKSIFILMMIWASCNVFAAQSLNFNESADFEFQFDYPLNGMNEIQGVLIFRRKYQSMGKTQYGEWEAADATSWSEWSEEQKCQLHSQIKRKHPYFWGKNFSCQEFIAALNNNIDPTKHISVATIDIPRLIGYVGRIQDDLKLDGSPLANGYCQKGGVGQQSQKDHSESILGTLDPVPLYRQKPVRVMEENLCRYEDMSKRKEEFLKGYRKNLSSLFKSGEEKLLNSFKIGFDLLIPYSYAFDEDQEIESTDDITLFGGETGENLNTLGPGIENGSHEFTKDEVSNYVKKSDENVSSFSDDLISKLKSSNNTNFSEIYSLVKGDYNACKDQDCIKKLFTKRLDQLQDCNQKRKKQHADIMAQGEARYGKDSQEFQEFKNTMDSLMEESEKDFQNTISTLEKAAETGDKTIIEKMVKDNPRVYEGDTSRMKKDIAYNEALKVRQEQIRTKQKNGEELTQEEKDTLNERATVVTNIVDSKTGEVIRIVEKDVDEYYNLETKVKAGSASDQKFESSVVDFSGYNDKQPSEKVEAIAARVMLEAQRRGENISVETANSIAKKYVNDTKPIINFDTLFNKSAPSPTSEDERKILAQSLSSNKSASKAALIREVIKKGGHDPETVKKLQAAYKMAQQKHQIKQSFIDNRIKENPGLGRSFDDRDEFSPEPPVQDNYKKSPSNGLAKAKTNTSSSGGYKNNSHTPRGYSSPTPRAGNPQGNTYNPGGHEDPGNGGSTGPSPKEMQSAENNNKEGLNKETSPSSKIGNSFSSSQYANNGSKSEASSNGSPEDSKVSQNGNSSPTKSSSTKGQGKSRGPASISGGETNAPPKMSKDQQEKNKRLLERTERFLGKRRLDFYYSKYKSESKSEDPSVKKALFKNEKRTVIIGVILKGMEEKNIWNKIEVSNKEGRREIFSYDITDGFLPTFRNETYREVVSTGNIDVFDWLK